MFRDVTSSTTFKLSALHKSEDNSLGEHKEDPKQGNDVNNLKHGNRYDGDRDTGESKPSQDLAKQHLTIKDKISDLWCDYRDNTSMHGLKKTEHVRKYKLRGIIWTLAVLGMATFLVTAVYRLYSDYMSYRTLNNVNVKDARQLSFPAITVCNLSPLDKSKINMTPQRMNLMVAMSPIYFFADRIDWNSSDYYNFTLPREMELNVSAYDSRMLLSLCKFDLVGQVCTDVWKQRITSLGMCTTFNSEGTLKSRLTGFKNGLFLMGMVRQDRYYFSNYIAAGIKVILHHPSEEPDVENEGFLASPGFATHATIRPIQYKYLTRPYKAFTTAYCLDTESENFVNKLKYYTTYSHFACINECRLSFIHLACNCRLETDPGNETICSFQQEMHCYKDARYRFDRNATQQDDCDCEYPCKSEKYEYQLSMAYFPSEEVQKFVSKFNFVNIRRDALELRVSFDSMRYTEVEQIPEYTLNSVAGTLGGLMGIFLGASILTISELLEFILFSAWIAFNHLFRKRETIVPN